MSCQQPPSEPCWICMQAYHGGINTNNYLEAMNKVMKYKFLNARPDTRLDSLITMYLEQISGWYWRMYVLDQVASAR
jgi:acyl-homoserine lactone acylase PvdQ